MNRSSRCRGLLVVALLGGTIALFFWKLLLTNLILASGDTFFYIYPYWTAASKALRAGRLPLWNPDLFMGAPFLANSQAGVLYPLNWPLWLAFDTPTAASLSIVLHLWLAAGFSYKFARSGLNLRRPAACLAAVLFALGGYLTAQVEHVNQLQGLAWLPAVFWLLSSKKKLARPLLLGIVLGLQLLAGHTQAAFITVVGAAVYAAAFVWPRSSRSSQPLIHLFLGGLLALLLAAAQILPTLELGRYSVRGGGLPLNEAVSFSLHPLLVGRALLPAYGETIFSEYVAFLPMSALLLALLGAWAGRRKPAVAGLSLVGAMGLFFALGAANPVYVLLVKTVPGLSLFRAPARWLVLYAFAAAALAGVGFNALLSHRPLPRRPLFATGVVLLLLLIAWSFIAPQLTSTISAPPESPVTIPTPTTLAGWLAEFLLVILIVSQLSLPRLVYLVPIPITAILFLASRALPYNHPTAPEAYHALRPAPAYLLAAATTGNDHEPPGRFLSISDIFFDPGDMGELESIYADQLDPDAFYDLIIATKQKEILAPNLPLTFDVPAVDGYDGGLLPLTHYVTLEHLLLPPEAISTDGRLRENLDAIPHGRWLKLFNVRYLITDKVGDVWSDGLFFDLQHDAILDSENPAVQAAYLPPLEATGLGIVLTQPDLPAGTAVAELKLRFSDGRIKDYTLSTGRDTSTLRDNPDGTTLAVVRWHWRTPGTPVALTISCAPTLAENPLHLHGLSLVDERDGAFQSVVISSSGRYRLVHSGDVKIYENLDLLPRAFLVGRATWVADESAALERMRANDFDPAGELVLVGVGVGFSGQAEPLPGRVTIESYRPERVELQVETTEEGWLVLSDAHYPGWEATVDGEPVPIQRADLLFRAVPIHVGTQQVIFTFRPGSVRLGLLVSGVAILCALMLGYRAVRVSPKGRRADPQR